MHAIPPDARIAPTVRVEIARSRWSSGILIGRPAADGVERGVPTKKLANTKPRSAGVRPRS